MFKNLKIIELASVLAGPSVGQFFAELGAEVIKIENPKTKGDITRTWKLTSETAENDISAYFSSINWGKKSVCLDITIDAELQQLYKLIKEADIVITSYKPGDAERLKVDYAIIKEINPQIIYGHISGYGTNSNRLGYDAIIQAESGFMFLNGEKDGNPVKMPVALIDVLAGHQLKEAILIALINKINLGVGANIEVSLFDTAVSSLMNQATNYLVAGTSPQRVGSEHPNIVPYGTIFKTKDDFNIVLAIGSDKQFSGLCIVLNIEKYATDQKYSTNQNRVKNRTELNNLLKETIIKFNKIELLHSLAKNNVPAGAINSIDEVFNLEETKSLLFNKDGKQGVKTFIAKGLSNTEITLIAPPHLGEHTKNILN